MKLGSWLTLLCGLVGLYAIGSYISEAGRPASTGGYRAREEPKPRKWTRPERGEIVTPRPRYLRACMPTRQGLSEMIEWQRVNDAEEMARNFLKYGGRMVRSGDQLKVLDPFAGIGVTKVRVNSDAECFVVSELTYR